MGKARAKSARRPNKRCGSRRAPAEARPDAFIPDLARSLWVLGDLYGEIEKPDVAIATLAEAIQVLTPTFLGFRRLWSGSWPGFYTATLRNARRSVASRMRNCSALRSRPSRV